MTDRPETCRGPGCDEPLEQPSTGRPRKYCSDACRLRAWRKKKHYERKWLEVFDA